MARAGICLVQSNPRGEEASFLPAYDEAHRELIEKVPGLRRVRLLRLAGEQLLPARSTDPGHRYLALYEHDAIARLAFLGAVPGLDGHRSSAFIDRGSVRGSFMDLLADSTEPSPAPAGTEPLAFTGAVTGPPGVFCSFTKPASAETEDEYNRWWTRVHLRDTLMLDGMERGRRYVRADDLQPAVDPVPRDYLAMYDVDAVGRVPWQRASLPWVHRVSAQPMTDALDITSVRGFSYETVSDLASRTWR